MLLLIAAFIGVQSIRRFGQLGQSIDVILKENYRSVAACEQMKEALERIDSGIVFLMLGEKEKGLAQIAENQALFRQALQVEWHNLTLPDEPRQVLRLQALFRQYTELLSPFSSADSPQLREAYFQRLLPVFLDSKKRAQDILLMNQENMNQANARARVKAARARRDMYLFLAFSALAALVFIWFSNRWILRPIRRLIRSAAAISSGNLNLVLKVEGHDEIGQLSEAFNAMAASLRLFRRTDQEKLLRVQRATQEAFRNLPQAVALLDAEGRIEIASAPAQQIFGLAPNLRIADLPLPWLAEIFRSVVRNAPRADRREHRYDVVQHFIANQERFFQPEAFPVFDQEKVLSGMILILEDVTVLRQSDEIKKSLFATVSHQLKTPLTAIRMALHLLLDEKVGDLNERQADLLVSARDESERLRGIIDDLLDISRLESGSERMNFAAVSPADLLQEGCAPFFRAAQDKGIRLEVESPPDLPDVYADRVRIVHVFANLLANAIAYTPIGGRVLVSAGLENDKVRFAVADSGRGIPEKYRQRIFEKFFRIPDANAEKGEGLGLAIAQEIVKAHHGLITFSSAPRRGSTFRFDLPLAQVPALRN